MARPDPARSARWGPARRPLKSRRKSGAARPRDAEDIRQLVQVLGLHTVDDVLGFVNGRHPRDWLMNDGPGEAILSPAEIGPRSVRHRARHPAGNSNRVICCGLPGVCRRDTAKS